MAPGGSFVTIVSSWCVVGRGNNALCGLMNSWAWWGGEGYYQLTSLLPIDVR